MKHPAILLSAVSLLGALATGCTEPPAASSKETTPGTPVVAATAIQQEIEDYSDFSGTLTSSQVVEIRARVEGYLLPVKEYTSKFVAGVAEYQQKVVPEYRRAAGEYEKAKTENRPLPPFPTPPRAPRSPDGKPIAVQEDFEFRSEDGKGGAGTIVEAGALLFVIDPEPFDVALDVAIAQLKQSQARLELAEANFGRYAQLLKQEAVTYEEYQRNKASRDVAAGQVAADEAKVHEAELNLKYTIMRAPFTGRVDRRMVDPGNLVGAEEKTLLTTIRAEHPMQVYFDVSEKVMLNLLEWKRQNKSDPRRKYEVLLKLDNEKKFVHKGYLDYKENTVDPSTGTALIRGEFPNQEGYLYSGLNVMVRVPGEPVPDAVLVHESAIGTDLGGKYVMTIETGDEGKDVAKLRHVEMGLLHGEMREVHGIDPGQKYIYEGIQQARDGAPVSVTDTVDLSRQPSPPAEPPQQSPGPEATSPPPERRQ